MAIGEDIPPELLAKIIANMSTAFDPEADWLPNRKVRRSSAAHCSLVCLYWAQQCRTLLFRNADVLINSATRATKFRRIVMDKGSDRLLSVASMIESVDVRHDLDKETVSYWQVVGALIPLLPASKLRRFHVHGPFPTSLASIRSPYWAISRPHPHLLSSYTSLRLEALHFKSMNDVVQFVTCFPHISTLHLSKVTWNKSILDAAVPTRLLRHTAVSLSPSLDGFVLDSCTDNASLWYRLAVMSKPRSIISSLPEEDQRALAKLATNMEAVVRVVDYTARETLVCEIEDLGGCPWM